VRGLGGRLQGPVAATDLCHTSTGTARRLPRIATPGLLFNPCPLPE